MPGRAQAGACLASGCRMQPDCYFRLQPDCDCSGCSVVAALLLEESVFLQALEGHTAIGFLFTTIVDKQQTLQITGQHVHFEVDL